MNEALFDEQIERLINWYRYEKYARQVLFDLLDEVQAHILAGSLKNDLNAQLAYIENVLMNAYDKVEEHIQPEPMVEAQSDYLFWLMTGLAAAYGVQKIIKPLAKAQQEKLVQQFTVGGLTLPEMLNKQRSDFVLKLKIAYRQAAVDDVLPEQDELNALFMRHKQNVQTMTKTLINSVVNETTYQFASVNPVIEGFRHVAVLDSRTTMVCTHRNGLVWDLDGKPYAHHEPFKKPPLHPNCRSCLVYVADISAPFDGVSGENWVKSRRLDELQAQFGKGIGQMLYDGKIQLYEALDGLKPLTLKQLQDKVDLPETIRAIERKTWTKEFKQKAIELYYQFAQAGFDLDIHGISRLSRVSKKGFVDITPMQILTYLQNNQANFKQSDGRLVFFSQEQQVAIIQSADDDKIISIIRMKKAKAQWKKLNSF